MKRVYDHPNAFDFPARIALGAQIMREDQIEDDAKSETANFYEGEIRVFKERLASRIPTLMQLTIEFSEHMAKIETPIYKHAFRIMEPSVDSKKQYLQDAMIDFFELAMQNNDFFERNFFAK